jgi:hypothetical protein
MFQSYSKQTNPFGRASHIIAHQHEGADILKINIKVFGLEKDVVLGWMNSLKECTDDQKKLGWKDSDICIILTTNSQQDAKVFLCLYMKWRCSYPQIKIFFECGTISQEWPLVFVCGKMIKLQKMIYF